MVPVTVTSRLMGAGRRLSRPGGDPALLHGHAGRRRACLLDLDGHGLHVGGYNGIPDLDRLELRRILHVERERAPLGPLEAVALDTSRDTFTIRASPLSESISLRK
jgi:hypothetical protein